MKYLLALILLLCPLSFASVSTLQVTRTIALDTGFHDLIPSADYDQPTALSLGSISVSRPMLFEGFMMMDHAFFIENRYQQPIEQYVAYTLNTAHVGNSALPACTNISGHNLAPFDGVYDQPPTNPTVSQFGGDWQVVVEQVAVPVSFTLMPGQSAISFDCAGGITYINYAPNAGPSHSYAIEWLRHKVRLVGTLQ